MANEMYRKGAVDKMVSAEELDQAPQAIMFQGWLLVILCVVLLVGCAVFSFVVEVPVSVQAPGIIWTPQGVRELGVNTNGVIKNILVVSGDEIKKGDVIAIVDQTDLQLEYSSLVDEQKSIQNYIVHLKKLNSQDVRLRKKYSQTFNSILDESNERLRVKEKRLSGREKELQLLRDKGHIEEERFNQLIDQLNETRERISSIKRDQSSQVREDMLSNLQIQKELLAQNRQAEQVNQQLSTLEKKILDKGEVIAPFSGTIIQLAVDVGTYLSPGQPVVTIEPEEAAENLQGLVYAAFQDGTKMRQGMEVEIELSAYSKEKYGVIHGVIEKIAQLPSSTEGMMRALKNDQLVQYLAGDGAPFEITISLQKDWADKSGYAWSARSSEVRMISNGMMCSAKVITRYKKLKDLFFEEVF